MSTNNGMPQLEIVFKGLGVSAIKRGERGVAVLIIKEETPVETFVKYRSVADLGTEELLKYTPENARAIKDALEESPLELLVFIMPTLGTLADTLKEAAGKIPRNCWVAVYSNLQADNDDLASWVKAENKNNKKRYKALVYKATTTDSMHVVNFTNESVVFADERTADTGAEAVPYLLGLLAGLSLTMSAIAKTLTKFTSVSEPEDLDMAISSGEFIMYNDEGDVKVARAVNSLITLTQGVTLEMTHINTVEKMDLIYTDILTSWNNSFKGKYPNVLDNQMLLISAINGYFKALARDYILDPNFENRSMVDIEAQRIANYPKYGESVVEAWDDAYAQKMTIGTNVYLKANIKITGIMEDFFFDIFM